MAERMWTLRERLAALEILAQCEEACAKWGVSLEEAMTLSRGRVMTPVSWARWEVWDLMRERGYSSKAIGRVTGFNASSIRVALWRRMHDKKKMPADQGPGGVGRQPAGEGDQTTKGGEGQ